MDLYDYKWALSKWHSVPAPNTTRLHRRRSTVDVCLTWECVSGSRLAGDTAHQQLSVNDEPDSRWVQELNAISLDPQKARAESNRV